MAIRNYDATDSKGNERIRILLLISHLKAGDNLFCMKVRHSHPNRKCFNNFIIARPKDNIKHAEAVILDNFDQLWVAYKTKNYNQTPASIILYSWIMPCNDCTDAIIKKLSTLCIPVTIVYTIPWTKESDQIQEKSRNRLKENRITVDCVNCPYRLQPKSQ